MYNGRKDNQNRPSLKIVRCAYYDKMDKLHEAYITAKLKDRSASFLEEHVRECEQCLSKWDELTNRSLESLPPR